MNDIYPIKEIPHLEQDQFYDALINGQLNSLDLPAREYFERQELIAEQVKKREILKQVEETGESYFYVHKGAIRGDEYDVPKFALSFFEGPVGEPKLIFFTSEEERDRTIEYFQKTGTLRYYNDVKQSEIEMEVYAVLPISVHDIYIRNDDTAVYDSF